MFSSRRSWMIVLAMMGVALLGSAQAAQAQTRLDFNMDGTHPATASISYAGGATPLVGVDISVDDVTGFVTPLNDGVELAITGGTLSFTTGNFSGATGPIWNFSGGGSIVITGGIAALGIPAGSVLMSGTFLSAGVLDLGGIMKLSFATFLDLKHPDLVAFYGLPNSEYSGALNLSFNAAGAPPSAFTSSSVGSGDVVNFPAPEPSSIVLLGIGAVGAVLYRRRKSAAVAA